MQLFFFFFYNSNKKTRESEGTSWKKRKVKQKKKTKRYMTAWFQASQKNEKNTGLIKWDNKKERVSLLISGIVESRCF